MCGYRKVCMDSRLADRQYCRSRHGHRKWNRYSRFENKNHVCTPDLDTRNIEPGEEQSSVRHHKVGQILTWCHIWVRTRVSTIRAWWGCIIAQQLWLMSRSWNAVILNTNKPKGTTNYCHSVLVVAEVRKLHSCIIWWNLGRIDGHSANGEGSRQCATLRQRKYGANYLGGLVQHVCVKSTNSQMHVDWHIGPPFWQDILDLPSDMTHWTSFLTGNIGPPFWQDILDLPSDRTHWTSLLTGHIGPPFWQDTYCVSIFTIQTHFHAASVKI